MGISKEEFTEYYKSHSSNSTKEHFSIKNTEFLRLIEQFSIEKHSKSENIKLTNIEKYGCENVFQRKEVKDKVSATKLERYGDSSFNNPEQRKNTCLDRYGSVSASGNKEVRDKINSTNLERFGVENPFLDKEFINNKIIEKYGSLDEFNKYCEEQREKSLLKTYGVTNSSQIVGTRGLVSKRMEETCLDKYGVSSATLLPQCRMYGKTSESKPNLQFSQRLLNKNIEFTPEFTIKNRSYDFNVGGILIEINPTATHNSTWSPYGEKWVKDRLYHHDKAKLAREFGFRCVNIWDWDDADKIVNLLANRDKVYARECTVKHVDKNEAKDFICRNHMQGYARDKVRLGLYYMGELVSIMTFGDPRYNKKYEYELIRYCSSKGVVGGAEKIFSHFIEDYSPKSIISYCDLSKFDGSTYEKLGFTLIDTTIGRHWYNIKTGKHITDNLLRQRGFDQLLGKEYGKYGKGTSNTELMLCHGFVEIYDCGQATYLLKI